MQLGLTDSYARSAKAADDESARLRKSIATSVKALTPFMARMKEDAALRIYAGIDDRALSTIRKRLDSELRLAELHELLRWLVQIAIHWETKSRPDARMLGRVIDLKFDYQSRR